MEKENKELTDINNTSTDADQATDIINTVTDEKEAFVNEINEEGKRHIVLGDMAERVERDRLLLEKKKKWKKFYAIHNVVFSIILLVLIALAYFSSDIMLYIASVICGIKIFTGVNNLKKSSFPKSVVSACVSIAIIIGMIAYVSIMPGPIAASNMKYYSFNKSWITTKFKVEKDLFPENLYGDGYYNFNTMPSLMQGAGWVSLEYMFRLDILEREDMKAYVDGMKARAISSFSLKDYHDPDIGQELDKDHVSIYYKTAMWEGYEEDAVVYVLDSHGTGNHPHSTVFILNEKHGLMQVSRLG